VGLENGAKPVSAHPILSEKPHRINVVVTRKGVNLIRMSENGKSRATCRRQEGSNPMKWFQIGLVLVAISIPAFTQDSQKKPDSTTTPPAPTPSSQSGSSANAQPASQTPAATVPAGVDNARYIIGSEDTLQIQVWKEPTLSGTIPVRPDGMISLVLVGDMPAAGKTPMQLADDIAAKLKKYIQDPNVSVLVMGVNSQKIFMVGEVGHVGPVMMTPGMSPLQAIATAGGLTPYANSKKIYILRGEAGKKQKIPFNYKEALKGDSQVELKPGDTIVVP
jgi:polysaccharide export outer membrane protein